MPSLLLLTQSAKSKKNLKKKCVTRSVLPQMVVRARFSSLTPSFILVRVLRFIRSLAERSKGGAAGARLFRPYPRLVSGHPVPGPLYHSRVRTYEQA